MKKILTLILLSLTFAGFAQSTPSKGDSVSIFEKAKYLKSFYSTETGNPVITVDAGGYLALKGLFNNTDNSTIIKNLNANPIFKGKILFKDKGASGNKAFPDLISSVGGLDVTKFANAISSLMIDRAKQELTISFFNRFSEISKKHPEFQVMFPKTTDNLRNLLTYNYPQMLPILRSGFFDDLEQITFNLEAVFELPRYRLLLKKFPEINFAIETLKLIHKLENGTSADEIILDIDNTIVNLEADATLSTSLAFQNMASTIHFAKIFSESLRSNKKGRIWISTKEAKDLVTEPVLCRLYLGLLWQQLDTAKLEYHFTNEKEKETKTVALTTILDNQKDNILLMQNRIAQFISIAEKVDTARGDIKTKKAIAKLTPEDYFNYISVSIDAIDYTLSLVKIFDPRLQADDYITIARKSNSLYKDIYKKQYTQAVNDAIEILSSVHALTKDRKFTTPDEALTYRHSSDTLSNFIRKAKPFALFIGAVAEAKTEDDIKSALENAILPVGSSTIKKYTHNNLSIQSYLGAYAGTSNDTRNAIRSWSDKVGIYGPIGLAYTPGFASRGKYGSFSLFASVFDLGAIIDYKLKEEPGVQTSINASTNTTKEYSVKLGQILSPGIHVVYGLFGNLPLSIGFGAQYGPGLSKIDAAGVTDVINPSWRYNLFLGVDLPFFTLINKTKTNGQ